MRVAERVRNAMSVSTKRRIADRRVHMRRATSFARPLPAFVIIGTQRGGTSSLYKYLEGHPDLAASIRKETEYFSRRFGEGESWYRAHFPSSRPGVRRLGFEATPDYLFYPPTPRRVAERMPDARFVVLLRDPVDRAYSHYRHMVRLGFEDQSFDEALGRETNRIASDLEVLERDPSFYCRDLLRFSYAARGRYAEHLARWFATFDRSRFLILRSEDFFVHPAASLSSIEEFLQIRQWQPNLFRNHSYAGRVAETATVPIEAAETLRQTLGPEVERLEELLCRSMSWSLAGHHLQG